MNKAIPPDGSGVRAARLDRDSASAPHGLDVLARGVAHYQLESER